MFIPFTGDHLRRLQAALLDAFDYGALRQMLQLYLEQDLDRLVAFRTANLEEMVHDLIRHYAAEPGGIHRLLTAAHNARPADVLLNALYGEYIVLDFAPQAPPEGAPAGLFTAPLPPGPPRVFVGRGAELNELHGWLARVTETGHGRLGVLYGPAGIGKRELLRQWLADLAERPDPPRQARTTLLLSDISDLAEESYYRAHPVWSLDWQRFGADLTRHFPQAFRLGSYPWIALAAQLAAQSPTIQAALATGTPWDAHLRLATEEAPVRAVTELLRLAARDSHPLVIAVEGVHLCSPGWLALLRAWEKEIRQSPLPVLLLLVLDHPRSLDAPVLQDEGETPLAWVRQQCSAPHSLGDACFVGPLTSAEVETLLASASAAHAVALHSLTEGNPTLLASLLDHWQQLGEAELLVDGRWRLQRVAPAFFTGALYEQLVMAPLAAVTTRAQALGYQVDEETLLEWLQLAVWEGDAFTDAVLAQAVGWPADALEEFQILLDEALRRSAEQPQGLLEELDETVALPYGDGQTRYLARYRLVPSLLAALLRQRQDPGDRLQRGQTYAQALLACYAPHQERIYPTLAWLYTGIGLPTDAATYRHRAAIWAELEQQESLLPLLQAVATDPFGKLTFLGAVHDYFHTAYWRRHPNQILPWLMSVLPLCRQLGQQRCAAATLTNIGLIYNALGEREKSLHYYNQALPLRRQMGDKKGEAATLHNIGDAYAALGEREKSLHYYSQALPLRRQMGDKGGEAATLASLGSLHDSQGDKQKALCYFNQALPLFRQVGDRRGEAVTLANLGTLHLARWEKEEALHYFNQALPLHRQVGDKVGEALTLTNIGSLHHTQCNKEEALHHYTQALLLHRQMGNKGGEALTLNNIGTVYSDLGDQQAALCYYTQALPLRRQVGDKGGEGATLNNIGRVYDDLGDQQEALRYYTQALPLLQQVGDKGGEAATLNNIGRVYADLGEQQAALRYYTQALPLCQQVGDKGGEAATLNNIGLVYADLGDQQAALRYYTQALPLLQQVGDKGGEAVTLTNIGRVYAALGEQQAALRYYTQALPLCQQVGDRWHESMIAFNLALLYEAVGDLPAAAALLREVVAIDAALNHPDQAKHQAALARIQGQAT